MLSRKFIRKGSSSNIYKTKTSLFATLIKRIKWLSSMPQNEVAMKVYTDYTKLYYRELNALKRLNGKDTVCQLVGFSPFYHTLYIELGSCDLLTYIDQNYPFSQDVIHTIICKIVDGVLDCHNSGIAHLDIKPENIVMKRKDDITSLSLIDFNSSSELDDPYTTILTTKSYRPPIIQPNKSYTEREYKYIDYYQVGMMAYILFTKHVPLNTTRDSVPSSTIPSKAFQFILSLMTDIDLQSDLSTLSRPYW